MAAVAGRSVCILVTMGPDELHFNNEFPGVEIVVRCPRCNRHATSVGSAITRSSGNAKTGLGHSVVLGMELERNGVSRCDILQSL